MVTFVFFHPLPFFPSSLPSSSYLWHWILQCKVLHQGYEAETFQSNQRKTSQFSATWSSFHLLPSFPLLVHLIILLEPGVSLLSLFLTTHPYLPNREVHVELRAVCARTPLRGPALAWCVSRVHQTPQVTCSSNPDSWQDSHTQSPVKRKNKRSK